MPRSRCRSVPSASRFASATPCSSFASTRASRADKVAFEAKKKELRAQRIQQIRQQRLQAYFEDLRKSAKIDDRRKEITAQLKRQSVTLIDRSGWTRGPRGDATRAPLAFTIDVDAMRASDARGHQIRRFGSGRTSSFWRAASASARRPARRES